MLDNPKIEFELICEDILNNDKFKSLNNELHHGITRYIHSIRVAKGSYKIAKFFKMKNYKTVTRASLLHDFYIDSEIDEYNSKEKLTVHPNKALENASNIIKLDYISEDIIKNHMYPLTKTLPKTKEGILVSIVDKGVSLYEMCFFKLSLQVSIIMLFIFNIINLND